MWPLLTLVEGAPSAKITIMCLSIALLLNVCSSWCSDAHSTLSLFCVDWFALNLPYQTGDTFLVSSLPMPLFARIQFGSRDLWEKMMSDSKEVVEIMILVITQYQLTFCCCCILLLFTSRRARAVTVLEWHLSTPDVDVFCHTGVRGMTPWCLLSAWEWLRIVLQSHLDA